MAEVHELTESYGESRITKRCGNPLNAQSIGAKILWLRRHEPEIYERTRYFFMAHTFVAHRLTGVYYLDHISASYSEPLYDVGKNKWIRKWVDDIAPGLPMPELKWPTEVIGHVTAEGAQRNGLPEGIPVAAGTMDSFADAMSVGVRKPGDAVVIYGSTMSIVLATDESLPSAQLWSNAHLFENTYNLESGMATSGSLTKWLRNVCGNTDFGELSKEAEAVAPGSDGLVILPYFAGERTPLLDPNARGTVIGLTLNHGRGHLYRALMEATAYGARHVLEVMHDAGGSGRKAFAVGGGTKGGLWPQIISDITGLTQEITEQSVGACYGDAMLIGVAGGFIDEDADWSPRWAQSNQTPTTRRLTTSCTASIAICTPPRSTCSISWRRSSNGRPSSRRSSLSRPRPPYRYSSSRWSRPVRRTGIRHPGERRDLPTLVSPITSRCTDPPDDSARWPR
jgi:xylulokinase